MHLLREHGRLGGSTPRLEGPVSTHLRLLTPKARLTRFDFDWRVVGVVLPLLAVMEGRDALRRALAEALAAHGILDR